MFSSLKLHDSLCDIQDSFRTFFDLISVLAVFYSVFFVFLMRRVLILSIVLAFYSTSYRFTNKDVH